MAIGGHRLAIRTPPPPLRLGETGPIDTEVSRVDGPGPPRDGQVGRHPGVSTAGHPAVMARAGRVYLQVTGELARVQGSARGSHALLEAGRV